MCLAVPMKVEKIENDTAVVEFGSIKKQVNIQLIEGLKKNDYVIVHAGVAIEKLDKKIAKETLELLGELKK